MTAYDAAVAYIRACDIVRVLQFAGLPVTRTDTARVDVAARALDARRVEPVVLAVAA